MIDITTDTIKITFNVGNKPSAVVVSSDGSKLYVTNTGDGTVSVIDTATNNIRTLVNVGNNPSGIAANPYRSQISVANSQDNNIYVITQ